MRIALIDVTLEKFKNMNPNIEMLNKIENDFNNLHDYLIPSNKISVNWFEKEKPMIIFPTNNDVFIPEAEALKIHSNALTQIGDKLNIPGKYLNNLYNGDIWQQKLFSTTLNEHFTYSSRNTDRFLLRSNNGILKAVLSDKFDRYNSIGVLTTFLDQMLKAKFNIGNVYYDGLSYFVEMNKKDTPIMINDEPHWISVQFRNSDFGQSALSINMMLVKQICTNGMVLTNLMRSIHKSKQMESGPNFKLSDKTLQLESEYKKSIINDIIPQVLSEENIVRITQYFDKLNKIDVSVDSVIEKLPLLAATKSDIDTIQNILMENKYETGVTTGSNPIRVANAISWIATGMDLENGESANNYKPMSGKLLSKYVTF